MNPRLKGAIGLIVVLGVLNVLSQVLHWGIIFY
jgi:hypothetical protein